MIGKAFLTAGEAVFTVETPADIAAKHYPHVTYKIEKVEATERWPEAYFVKVLAGPDNENDFIYVGKLNTFTGQCERTAKSSLPATSFRFRLLNRVLCRLWGDDGAAIESAGYKVRHEGKCGRCGRRLTVPASIESGIGPECSKILSCTSAS